jgi:hypothetical protein
MKHKHTNKFNERKGERKTLAYIAVIFLFALSLFLLPTVSAVPTVTTTQNFPQGYSIYVHPIQEYFKAGQDVILNAHVTNSSNGYPINTSINCILHLYNSTGEHINIQSINTTHEVYDYEFTILGGNFTKETKSYHIFCFNGGFGGDYAKAIEVTQTGIQNTILFYIVILLISVGVVILGFSINDPWVVVIGGFTMVLVGLFTIIFGIGDIKDNAYTWGIGVIIIMLGSYFGIRSAIEGIVD